MIIKNNSTSLLVTLTVLLILPFVQKQWFNLYLFNINNISFYSILYYLSGTICPSLICLNSLKNFTSYKFYKNKIYGRKTIKGKALFLLVAINLLSLSFLISDYVYINYELICNIFLEKINLQKPDIFYFSLFIFLIAIFLIFKKSRLLFKKLILVNFILVSFNIWHLQINNIIVDDLFHINRYFGLNNLNLINILILLAIEILYFSWSFLSYKTNLSDWNVRAPQKADYFPILNMSIFYFLIYIYYSVLT